MLFSSPVFLYLFLPLTLLLTALAPKKNKKLYLAHSQFNILCLGWCLFYGINALFGIY